MTIEICVANNYDNDEWDALISKSSHGTLFHQWKWLKITEKHTRSILYPLIGSKAGKVVGVIPLFVQKNGPLTMVFSPPPHVALFYLGPVMMGFDTLKQMKKEMYFDEFQESFEMFIENTIHAHYSSFSLPPNFQDPRHFVWAGYSVDFHYDYKIDLRNGCDALLQSVDKNQRQNISRAKKRGITVELGGKEEYEKILDLMDTRYAHQGKKVMVSRSYFLDIYDAYKDILKIFVAKINGEIVTGSIDFHYRDTHYSWIGNPKPVNPITPSPNDLLIWESICYAYNKGLKYYVTMNAAGNQRLYSYYASKFNPELTVHFSVKKTSYLMEMIEKGYFLFYKSMKT